MLMEWLEPTIKMRISEMHVEAENSSRDLYNRLSKIIHETMKKYPQQSIQAMEIEEIFNEMLTTSIDMTYRRGFKECFELLKELS